MYRIRSGSGTEAVYNSLEEFSAAVRRGAVAAEDEIFHLRANRWLDVKSHPHYRLAIGGAGHQDAKPHPAPPSASPASPVAPVRPAPGHPPVRSSQTAPGPRLVAEPAQVAAPARPQKSKDLAFIDLGGPAPGSQRNPTVIEARKVPAPIPAKAEPRPAPSRTEAEFLVMNDGIDSPVRTSTGHRAAPDDLDLLFDAPIHPLKSPSTPGVTTAVAPPKAQAAAAPRVAALKVEKAEAVIAKAPEIKVPPAPVAAAVAPKAPHPPVRSPKPVVEEDLTIPGGVLLEAPGMESHAPVAVPAVVGRSMGMLAAAGIAILVVIGGLLAWKPWSGRAASTSAASTSAAPMPAGTPLASLSGTPVAGEPVQSNTPANPAAAAPPVPKPVATPTKADSVAARPADDQVIAASRPNFQTALAVPSGDLGLGSEIGSVTAPSAVVPPTEFTRRLETAEKLARLELGTKLGGFHGLLAPNRLATAEGVSAARSQWSSGAEVIREYRARIARMEKAYEDSVLSSQRARRWPSEEMRAWAGHSSQAEPVETSQLADLMVSQVSEGLDLLAALDGQYQLKGGVITFSNPVSGTRYTSIRGWVEQRMQTWSGTPESARAISISALLKALGDGFPATQ